jgi:hypothetical protein
VQLLHQNLTEFFSLYLHNLPLSLKGTGPMGFFSFFLFFLLATKEKMGCEKGFFKRKKWPKVAIIQRGGKKNQKKKKLNV